MKTRTKIQTVMSNYGKNWGMRLVVVALALMATLITGTLLTEGLSPCE